MIWFCPRTKYETKCMNVYIVHLCAQLKIKFCCYLLNMGKLLGSSNVVIQYYINWSSHYTFCLQVKHDNEH
jgi:hypothetical protein